jgi:hypothetical protein
VAGTQGAVTWAGYIQLWRTSLESRAYLRFLWTLNSIGESAAKPLSKLTEPISLGARNVIPYMLELLAHHGVRATLATVGFLLFDKKDELLAYLPSLKPGYHDRNLSLPMITCTGSGRMNGRIHFTTRDRWSGASCSFPGVSAGRHLRQPVRPQLSSTGLV